MATVVALAAGCGDDLGGSGADADPGADADLSRPDTYAFDSRFVPGQSSVAYHGQAFRQTLIAALKSEIGSWTDRVYSMQEIKSAAQWTELLNFYFRFDELTSLDQPIDLGLALPTAQATWGDISSGANLIDKLAGQDDTTDHKDWDGDGEPAGATGSFVGWTGATSPLALVDDWFAQVSQLAVDRAAAIPTNPVDGAQIEQVYITESGQDLRQLIQKFMLVAITFSQGADDYLDIGTEGKGLDTANTQDGDKPYSVLEHAWDEAFGYVGARRDYGDYTDRGNADPGYADSNGDGTIDITSELNTGMAINAAKRDLASQPGVETDFSATLYDAMVTGRHIIWRNAGADLPENERTALIAQRDIVVSTWEQVFAATAIHYINETITEMNKMGTAQYSFTEHAKVWSELKGFALAFQFNPNTPLSDGDFAMLHTLVRDAPELVMANLAGYEADLLAARSVLQTAYGFDAANVIGW